MGNLTPSRLLTGRQGGQMWIERKNADCDQIGDNESLHCAVSREKVGSQRSFSGALRTCHDHTARWFHRAGKSARV